jgi:two-component system, LytTR family, sensor kinase
MKRTRMLTTLSHQIRKRFIIPHLLFWLLSIILFAVLLVFTRNFSLSGISLRIVVSFFITILYLAISVYINLLWLVPVFFKKRRFILFTVLQLGNILLFILLNFFTSYIFESGHRNFWNEFVAEFILVSIFISVTTLLKFMRDSIALQDAEIRVREVERAKIGAELQVLKSQVNPHFFFNTLNSLYSLSLDKSDKTPEMILKLSGLMRYIIYEARDNLVPLARQLEFLRNYVSLEQLRSGERLRMEFEVEGEHTEIPVDPLMFIAFVENTFKHGVQSGNRDPYIRIFFNLTREGQVRFLAENNYEPQETGGDSEGIGLSNVKKRLDLLYPGKYDLNIHDREGVYRVDLTIRVS